MIIFRERNPGEILLPPVKTKTKWWDIDSFKFLEQFYQIYKDSYDFIALFPTKKLRTNSSFTINLNVAGIGAESIEINPNTKRLKSLIELNFYPIWDLDHPTDIHDTLLKRVLIHEIGHYWSIYDLKGLGISLPGHWTNNLDLFNGDSRYVDIMGYHQWIRDDLREICVDADDKTVKHRFSDLTLYLMGLIPKEQVKPIYVHDFKERPGDFYYNTWGPRCEDDEYEFLRTRTVTIYDIIKANGKRNPSYEESQKDFRVAFVILTEHGADAPPEFIDYINKYKEALPGAWNQVTAGKSTISP